jgi:hypothetical protein
MTSPTIIQAPGLTVAVAKSGTVWLAYPLTPCCQASGKGSERGVVCRSCYNEVSAIYGDCAVVNEEPGDWPCERIIAAWADLDDEALDALVAQIKAVAS